MGEILSSLEWKVLMAYLEGKIISGDRRTILNVMLNLSIMLCRG
jgi:hypothetical protein